MIRYHVSSATGVMSMRYGRPGKRTYVRIKLGEEDLDDGMP